MYIEDFHCFSTVTSQLAVIIRQSPIFSLRVFVKVRNSSYAYLPKFGIQLTHICQSSVFSLRIFAQVRFQLTHICQSSISTYAYLPKFEKFSLRIFAKIDTLLTHICHSSIISVGILFIVLYLTYASICFS